MPCGTCRRSSITCIFESTSPKRGATKHYIESLENRIHVIERALNSLGGPTMQIVEEAVRRQQLVDENGVQEGQQGNFICHTHTHALFLTSMRSSYFTRRSIHPE